ncbi:MAG: T9SS type A sorting domain-containing protein [Bacteroidia bacterium]
MNPIYKLFLLFLFIAASMQASAATILSSELRWKSLGNDSFEITAIIFTDCNGTALGDTIEVKLQGTDVAHAFTDTVSLYKIFSADVTGQCTSVQNRCQLDTSTFAYGIEKHIYKDTIDLSSRSGCSFRVSFSECCRSGDSYTSGPLYTFCDINSCDTFINSSPVLENDPEFLIVSGQCYIYNFQGTDADGDSLVYSLVPSLQDSVSPLVYNSLYSYDWPLNTGIPFPGPPSLQLCRGLYLWPESGDLMFRPMQQQSTWFATEVTEYRNGIKIGSTRREWQQIVINSPGGNETPRFSGTSSARVCEGDTLNFDFLITDRDSADTVRVLHSGLMPGASITYTGSGDSVYGHLEWIPKNTAPGRYNIRIIAKDNACPVNNLFFGDLHINLDSMPAVTYSARALGCGQVELDAPVLPNMDYTWGVDTFTLEGENHTHKFDSGGWEPFYLEAEHHSCSAIFSDSVFIPHYQKVTVSVGPDTAVCWNGWAFLVPTVLTGNGGYEYLWLPDSLTSEIYQGKITTLKSITLEVTDSVGCKGSDQLMVYTLAPPALTLSPLETCSVSDTIDLAPFASPAGGNWVGPGVSNNMLELAHATFGDWFYYSYSDTNGCSSTDSVRLAKAPDPVVSAGQDFYVCENSGMVMLGGSPVQGVWSGPGVIRSGVQWNFSPAQAGVGISELVYTVTDSLSCMASDTIRVTVHQPTSITVQADFSRCLNEDTVKLTGQPSGGAWTGKAVNSGIFYPQFAGAGIHPLRYVFSDSNGCVSRDTLWATVHAVPQVNAGNGLSACKDGWPVPLSPQPAGGTWSGSSVVSGNFYPSLSGLGSFYLTYSFTNAAGCSSSDSLLATVHDLPEVNALADTAICINEPPLALAGQPAGGTWTGPGIVGNWFMPSNAGTGKHQIIYSYTGLCANSDTSEIEVLPRPQIMATVTPVSTYSMQFNLTSSDSLAGIHWDFGDGHDTVQRNPLHTYPTGQGNYLVVARGTGANGCWNTDTLQVIIDPLSTNEMPWMRNVQVFPNPVSGTLTAIPQNGTLLHTVELQNAIGKKVLQLELINDHFTGNVSELAPGIYFLEIFNSNKERAVVKVVVQ